jgi:hypothetical protein
MLKPWVLVIVLSSGLGGCSTPCGTSSTRLQLIGSFDVTGGSMPVEGRWDALLTDGRATAGAWQIGAAPNGAGVSVDLTAVATRLAGLDFFHLDGSEIAVGETFTGNGSIDRPDTPSEPVAMTYRVSMFAAPRLPADLDADRWSTPNFLGLDVAGTSGNDMIAGEILGGLYKITERQGCCDQPPGCS